MDFLYYIFIIFSIILVVLGLLGSILPVLPGPPLAFIGLLLFAIIKNFSPPLTSTLIIIMFIITVVISLVDYFLPVIIAKKYGTSKWGLYGSILGMIIGAFLSPFGMILGALIGAVVVEWIISKKRKQALEAGWGVFIGSIFGMILKLVISGIMTYYLVISLF